MFKRQVLATAFFLLITTSAQGQVPFNAMGEKAGEVDQHSAILMTRLTAVPERDSLGGVRAVAF